MALHKKPLHHRVILCAFAALAIPGWCAAADQQIRPGEWEVSVRMEMPGMPATAQQTHTSKNCVTPEMARDPRAAAEKLNNRDEGGMKCKMGNFATSGNKSTWDVVCTGDHPAQMVGEMIHDGDSAYSGTTKMTMQGPQGPMHMTQVINARRIGDCSP